MQRSVASLGLRMWRRCAFASVLSYKKVTRGSEILPGYAMQAPGLVDLKRRFGNQYHLIVIDPAMHAIRSMQRARRQHAQLW
eukprot:COSAG05_NODE_682_length_7957_cov_277.290405_8_plen_82_part_00